MLIGFDPLYLLMVAPALILALWAQMRVKSAYAAGMQVPAELSGAAAARHILDSAGLEGVEIEEVPGHLSDHYDPRDRVLRLSPEVYEGRSAAAVGIAAHEAGHALQHAQAYAPLAIRNAAVPVASFGAPVGGLMILAGALVPALGGLILLGILLFGATVFFQVVNLPVEFNASSRAKEQLAELGIVHADHMPYVRNVLNAAAWTYVAATLESILVLLYYIIRFTGGNSDRD